MHSVPEINNKLLTEKVEQLQNLREDKRKNNSYATQVSKNADINKLPGILIEFKDIKDNDEIKKLIQDNILLPKFQPNIKSYFQLKNGKIIIRCCSIESKSILIKEIQSKFQGKAKIKNEEFLKPTIKIVGVHGDSSVQELNKIIIKQNLENVKNFEFNIT